MRTAFLTHLRPIVTAAAVALAGPAGAADALTDAMQDAYVPYRAALFRTNSKAQAESEQALSQRLSSQAPAALSADADFATGVKAVAASVAALKSAVMAQDAAASREALGKLKPPYSRLFLKFG